MKLLGRTGPVAGRDVTIPAGVERARGREAADRAHGLDRREIIVRQVRLVRGDIADLEPVRNRAVYELLELR